MLRRANRNKNNRPQSGRKKTPGRGKIAPKRGSWRKLSSRSAASAKSGVDSRVSSRHQAQPHAKKRNQTSVDYETALKNFETALGHLRKQHYEKAAAFFEKVATSPVQEMAERARMHLRLCAQKRRQQAPPKTAEDFYLQGVAALNNRDTERAIQYLAKSDKMVPNREHVHYALAVAHGLHGNPDPALIHLQTAIELQPANRVRACLDDDFQVLAADPRFGRLVGPRT